jgi:hypothetical protein
MATPLPIELDAGVYTGLVHREHNGYYAGDFSAADCAANRVVANRAANRVVVNRP